MKMVEFVARDRDEHLAHWHQILADGKVRAQTVVEDIVVVGTVLSFDWHDEREIGYWIGREYWGRGIASKAVAIFLELELGRPLYGRVAKSNLASRRVLEKCGFALEGEVDGKLSWVLR
jgi:RimJ/RimL family protein N-acetyltransferase